MLKKVVEQLEKYRSEYPQEKIHLHLDKPYYANGDTIWFKAYLVNSEKNQLTEFSRIIHVDLINDKDSAEQTLLLNVEAGTASGDFALPDDLPDGYYRIRAYTRWMRNFGEDYFFNKTIYIGNPTFVNNSRSKSKTNEFDLQFFPEGGNLLAGINSKVAFKALNADGLGIDVGGFIFDQNRKKVAEFKTEHLGMGYFSFQPQKGLIYQATVQLSDGSQKSYPLPEVQSEGYSLSCSDSDTNNLKIVISSPSSTREGEELTLVAQSNGTVHYASKNKMTNHIIEGSLPKKRFPIGILQLTLFSSLNEPIAERLVFINHSDFLNIEIRKDQLAYSKRQQGKMTLEVKDEGKPSVGSFSVAIIDETRVPFDDDLETTILSNLLLTSDLKGHIERPNYYFSNTDDRKRKHIDLLMLTQGYSRFTWKNLLQNLFPPVKFKPEEGLEISGIVTQLNGKTLINTNVELISTDDEPLILNTRTNNAGRFIFSNLFFNDSTKFVLQAVNPKNKSNIRIQADGDNLQVVTLNKNYPGTWPYDNDFMVKFLENNSDVLKPVHVGSGTKLLQEAVITRKKVKRETSTSLDGPVKNSTNLNGAGNADVVIPGEKLQKFVSLFDGIMFNLPAGIGVKNGAFISRRSPGGVQVILDGIYIDQSDLSTINPRYVEAIEILYEGAKTSIYGKRTYGMSVMLITSISGTARSLTPQIETPGLLRYSPKGLHRVREFYSPGYSIQNSAIRTPDLRSTAYWNPKLFTDSTGTTTFNFFTTDRAGDYKVIIEGININGKIGRQILRFKVE